MFEIDGVDEKTRAILLGPYNTRAAREYFEPSEDDDALNLDSDIDLDNSELNLEEDLNLEEEIKL
jgi:hypothetical protein